MARLSSDNMKSLYIIRISLCQILEWNTPEFLSIWTEMGLNRKN